MLLWFYTVPSFVLFEIVSSELSTNASIFNLAAKNASERTTLSGVIPQTTVETKNASKYGIIVEASIETIPTEKEYYEPVTQLTTADLNEYGRSDLMEDHVITCDGYILNPFRIRQRNTSNTLEKYPVLFFHGMMQSSDSFIENENQNAAFILAKLGFDVWLGNNRGNKYGRLHLYLEPDMYGEKYKFFNYSYEEIGIYDVAATVDYILQKTGAEKLHYIGVSQGATAFLALNSLEPHYNDKFKTAHLLAPLGYQRNFNNSKIEAFANITDEAYEKLLEAGTLEIFPYNSTFPVRFMSPNNCLTDIRYQILCKYLDIGKIMKLDNNKFRDFDTRGGAIKQIAHYGQNIRDRSFRRWDYGAEENKVVYGTDRPPEYDLRLVTVKTVLYYSLSDEYVAPNDVIAMAADMPNARAKQVIRRSFTHQDFVTGKDLISCVYKKVFRYLGKKYREEGEEEDDDDDEEDDSSTTKLKLSYVLYALPLLTLKFT